ncbi:MAG: helix-turn-helix transcriptional regulator [Solirubrobacterales bacterium]|nr:helix-turn-helix transcriptional regulator [Solirubrobacterales bacterium]
MQTFVREQRRDQRWSATWRSAARVFAERGCDQKTIQDLADAIGLAAGGIYHYMGSKEQLLTRICNRLMEPPLANCSRRTPHPPTNCGRLCACGSPT